MEINKIERFYYIKKASRVISGLFVVLSLNAFAMTGEQAEDELKACIRSGKSFSQCKSSTRSNQRQEKATEFQKEKTSLATENLKNYQRIMDESVNSQNYIVQDQMTGEVIDLRNLSFIERDKVRCRLQGGNWSEGQCLGNVKDVEFKEIQKSKNGGYIKEVVDNIQGEQIWSQVDANLSQKEQLRKQQKEYKKWLRKVAKYYGVSKDEAQAAITQNPNLFYQAVNILQQQEAYKKQQEEINFQNALNDKSKKDRAIFIQGQDEVKRRQIQVQRNYNLIQGQRIQQTQKASR